MDVWSTGIVLFAMMAGHLPFHAGSNKQELCQKILRGVPPFPVASWTFHAFPVKHGTPAGMRVKSFVCVAGGGRNADRL